MKKLLLLKFIALSLFALFTVGKVNAQATATDLFISEYLEGSSNNRALEIFNGTGASVDLSTYSIKTSYNGEDWGIRGGIAMTEYVLPLTGTLANGTAYVIYNNGASAATIAVGNLMLTYDTGTPGSRCASFTGNDAIGLFKSGVLIDVIGVPTENPSSWNVADTIGGTLDNTLIRKASVIVGSTDWALSAGTTADNSQWIVKSKDDISNLGLHTFGSVGVNRISSSRMSIYPNPAKSYFNVKAPAGDYRVSINNSIGSLVKSVDLNSTGRVEMSDLRPGIYYVTIENMKTNRKEVQKLIVR